MAAPEDPFVASAQDFLRFYVLGGAAVLQAAIDPTNPVPTSLISATPSAISAALQNLAAQTTAQTTIESDPLAAFAGTPGISRRIPAICGAAPDFIQAPNADLTKASFSRPLDASGDPVTSGLAGPLMPELNPPVLSPQDIYVDMCAVEDVVVTSTTGQIQVSLIWAQDYPGEALESPQIPDPTTLPDTSLPRIRAVVDQAQPSVIVSECMEALQAFVGQDVFEQFSFSGSVVFCPFEQVAATVRATKASG
jgi:hypothetical protein